MRDFRSFREAWCGIALALFLIAGPARSQTYEALHSFSAEGGGPQASMLQAADGKLYGTTIVGGLSGQGSVFTLTPDGAGGFAFATLHSFSGSDGAHPIGSLIQARDGYFYGTTYDGGGSSLGTVFRMDASGNVTRLHSFGSSEGSHPRAGLIQAVNGYFYGTAQNGGASGNGTVFKMDASGNITNLHSFLGSDGSYPFGALIQASNGDIYGTTFFGGVSGRGTVFKIDYFGNVTTLHSLTSSEGAYPSAGLIQAADGNLYGTTQAGGFVGFGTAFKITASGDLTTLHSFWTEGSPSAGLIQAADGSFYGTTATGGFYGFGTTFKMDASGNVLTLHSFANSDGDNSVASLIQATDGNFYGTTNRGGAAGLGTAFQMDASGSLTTVHSFANADGNSPHAALIQATDGNFYGTTYLAGANGDFGTVFKMEPSGALTTLHSFTQSDGANPFTGLIQATDGNFYGTTSLGGAGSRGTIFRMDALGNITTLHSNGVSGLIQATDGNFYGTTGGDGANGRGTAFRMDASGNFTTLHSFAGSEGASPGGLIQAADGNFYGTTQTGGATNRGTVFKMDASGNVTTLHSFTNTDGAYPNSGLIQATDGNFYGTTNSGGTSGRGTVFKMDPSGNVTTLHSFVITDGDTPHAGLIQATDGNFYGTVYLGGANNKGTVFRIDALGSFTILHSFTQTDGAFPDAGLLQGADGNLYGTTQGGGAGLGGVVFRLTIPACPQPPVAANDGPICAGQTLHLTATTVAGATYGWTGPNGFVSSLQNPSIPNATTAASGDYSVRVTVGGCSSPAATTTASVRPVPTAVASGSATIVPGASTPLTGSGGVSCSWSPATGLSSANSCTPTASPSVTTTYTLTVTSADGCVSANNPTVTVTVLPAPKLTVTKIVVNDNGGTKQVADFPLFVDGGQVPSGVQNTFNVGLHTVSETSSPGYAATFGGDCAPNGSVSLAPGDVKSCTVTNDDLPPLPRETRLMASGGLAGDSFGAAVAISGDTAVVGANGRDEAGDASGAAYAFMRSGGAWSEQQELTRTDGAAGDQYGASVALDGDVAVIGASGDDDAGLDAGAAYVFVRSGGVWSLQQKITASDATAGDRFGNRVAVSGDTALVGSAFNDGAGSDAGAAYVFARSGEVWIQQQKLTAGDAFPGDRFGFSVAVTGDTAVIGSPRTNLFAGEDYGAAYAFVRSDGVWSLQQKLTASDGAPFDEFGYSVSVSGDTALVGAHFDAFDVGSAYVFVRSGGVWSEQQELTAGDAATGDQFGLSVAVSEDMAVVASPFDDDAGSSSGSAYVFLRSGGTWNQQQKLAASDAAADDDFGFSVAVNAGTVLVGSVLHLGPGAAYVYERDPIVCPPPAEAGNDGPKCAGQTLQLTASTVTGAEYLWTGPNGFISNTQNPSVANATSAASGTYSVRITLGSCPSSTATTTATIGIPPTAVASGSTAICAGSSTPLTGSGGASCSWSPSASLDSATSCSPAASPSTTTTYTLTVTDANGCTSTNNPSVTVTVNTPPTASVSGGGAVCAGESRTIQAALTGTAPWNLTWSDGVTQTGVASSPAQRSVSPSETTTYTVTAVSDATCGGTPSGSAVITVNARPTAVAAGSAAICAGSSTPLTGSGGVSCSWSPSTGLSDAASCSPAASPSATTTYTLTVTDGSGCASTNSATVTVTVNPPPAATITPSGATTFCAGGSVTLTASAGSSYLWSTGATTQAITVAASGSYSVTVTDSNGCYATSAATTVTVNPRPTAVASGTATIVVGSSTPLNGSGGVSCSWSPATGLSSASSCSPMASPAVTTTYTLTVTSSEGCASANGPTVTVTVLPAPKLTVTKVVINDNGGTKKVADFPLFVDATRVTSGVQNTFNAGAHTVSETSNPGYAATFSGHCAANGSITLNPGDVKSCTITNDDFKLPDLTVSALTAPAAAVAGSTISVTDTTQNLTGTGAAGASTTRFYLSANSTWEAGDTPLGGRAVPALAPGATSSRSTSLTIPAGTATATWYIIARADGDVALSESNETNNTRSTSIKISPPDLSISSLTAPATGGAGLPITVNDTTKNQAGTGPAPASTTRFYLSSNSTWETGDTPLGSRAVPALAPGATSSGSTSLTIPAATATGSWYIIAKADADNLVSETTETNNTRTSVIKLSPDLIVSAISAPTSTRANVPISVTDTTKNQGQGSAAATTTTLYLSTNTTYEAGDVLLTSRVVPILASGASSAVSTSVTIPAGTATGTWYILARADAAGAVSETNEANNVTSKAITITP